MNCPNCGGIKTIHAIDPITVPGEYACEICNHEFYGNNMREAIKNAVVSTYKPEAKE